MDLLGVEVEPGLQADQPGVAVGATGVLADADADIVASGIRLQAGEDPVEGPGDRAFDQLARLTLQAVRDELGGALGMAAHGVDRRTGGPVRQADGTSALFLQGVADLLHYAGVLREQGAGSAPCRPVCRA